MVLAASPLIGIGLGTLLFESQEPILLGQFVAPTVNSLFLNICVGSLACMFGCIFNRRSLAVGVTVSIILTSTIINFLEPFLSVIGNIRFLSLLHYFRPVEVVRDGQWPHEAILCLLVLTLIFFSIGLHIYVRKDIPSV